MTSAAPSRLAVIAAVNNEEILARDLLRSPLIREQGVPAHCYRGCRSAAEAYNRGLDETDADILLFAHQDVYFPKGWLEAFRTVEAELARTDPDWGVLGVYGLTAEGRPEGHVWCSAHGRMLGGPFDRLVPTICIDELLIVVRRSRGLRFDGGLPGFHLYGTDIVRAGLEAGKGCYLVNLPVIHNARPVSRLKADYARALGYMRRKWWSALPLPTLVVPVTKGPWPLWRVRLRHLRHRKEIARRSDVPARSDPALVARQLELE